MIVELFNHFKAALPASLANFPHDFGRLALVANGSYPA